MAKTGSVFTPGRILIILGNLSYSIGAFVADFNETHVLNPRWPPHAKFHNGQTMSLGVLLAATSSYFVLRSTSGAKAEAKFNILMGAIVGSYYCLSGLSAILYPETAWLDPEFDTGGMTQKSIFTAILGVIASGYFIEARRLA